ncbi:UNVERIFIED_CONTAM: hypothetical protein FKN15_076054 [Acipenser sinensis]
MRQSCSEINCMNAVLGGLESRGVLRKISDMLEVIMKRIDSLSKRDNVSDTRILDELSSAIDRSSRQVLGGLESRGVLRKISDMLEVIMKRIDSLSKRDNVSDTRILDELSSAIDSLYGNGAHSNMAFCEGVSPLLLRAAFSSPSRVSVTRLHSPLLPAVCCFIQPFQSVFQWVLEHCAQVLMDPTVQRVLEHCVQVLMNLAVQWVLEHCAQVLMDPTVQRVLEHCVQVLTDPAVQWVLEHCAQVLMDPTVQRVLEHCVQVLMNLAVQWVLEHCAQVLMDPTVQRVLEHCVQVLMNLAVQWVLEHCAQVLMDPTVQRVLEHCVQVLMNLAVQWVLEHCAQVLMDPTVQRVLEHCVQVLMNLAVQWVLEHCAQVLMDPTVQRVLEHCVQVLMNLAVQWVLEHCAQVLMDPTVQRVLEHCVQVLMNLAVQFQPAGLIERIQAIAQNVSNMAVKVEQILQNSLAAGRDINACLLCVPSLYGNGAHSNMAFCEGVSPLLLRAAFSSPSRVSVTRLHSPLLPAVCCFIQPFQSVCE